MNNVYEETSGQPWLVNRLGTILTVKIKPETTDPITAEDVDEAISLLLEEKNNHFDNLFEKIKTYKRAFIRILTTDVAYKPYNEDQSVLEQYGLIINKRKKARVANSIYEKLFEDSLFDGADVTDEFPDLTSEKKIFISYSREDREWLNLLLPHLGVLEHRGVTYWFDEKIRAGDEWAPEIQNAIETSRVAVCLISTNFLNSSFIRNREIPEILKHSNMGMQIVPVLIETCAWKQVPWLSDIQVIDQTTLTKSDPEEQKEKLVALVDQIAENI